MNLIKAEEKDSFERIKKAISEGKIVIYPTDTVYGMGGNALDKKVVERIYKIKKRDGKKPLSVIMGNINMILEYCQVTERQMPALLNNLPGPFTFILKLNKKIPVTYTNKIGARVPEHQLMRRVSAELNIPIISTSANLSGERDATRIEELNEEIAEKADLVVDGGSTKYRKGSTVVDLVGGKILRKGAVEFSIQYSKV